MRYKSLKLVKNWWCFENRMACLTNVVSRVKVSVFTFMNYRTFKLGCFGLYIFPDAQSDLLKQCQQGRHCLKMCLQHFEQFQQFDLYIMTPVYCILYSLLYYDIC